MPDQYLKPTDAVAKLIGALIVAVPEHDRDCNAVHDAVTWLVEHDHPGMWVRDVVRDMMSSRTKMLSECMPEFDGDPVANEHSFWCHKGYIGEPPPPVGASPTARSAWIMGADHHDAKGLYVHQRIAERLALKLHAGMSDKAGVAYICHLASVVQILLRRWPNASQDEIDAAWLHDALEDTVATRQRLLAEGLSERTVEIVEAVSRPQGVTYQKWIQNLANSGDIGAIRVKLADNEHNSDPSRRLPRSDIVEKRYIPARLVLEEALAVLENT